ncbi:hypothetical protein, partial [Streptomyces javensis]|uniref:hypothetical protein n=1 Tax=Streptomyces javensis TaxID=114698 RepID=UPI001BE4BA5C
PRVDGVSTYLALTFGTLLSSQGTDASFETVSPVSPGASLRCFQPYQIRFPVVSDPNSVSGGRWRALPFGVFSTLADDHPPNLIGFA